MEPFLTFYTPTYKRPAGLARCLASVAGQTAVADVEHLMVADHCGVGVDGMYGRIPRYVDAVHGRYVHVLSDDAVLASPTVVGELREFVETAGHPACVVVRIEYEPFGILPNAPMNPPRLGHVGLSCLVVRRDVWADLTRAGAWGLCYEGDFEFAHAAWKAGHAWTSCPVLFVRERQGAGAAEVA